VSDLNDTVDISHQVTIEKLQAIASPWAEWVSELETKHVICDGGLAQVLEWDTKRGRDFQCLAHFVYCCEGFPDQHLLPTAAKMEKWLTREDSPTHGFKVTINDVLTMFYYIASTPKFNKGFKLIDKRLAPVEFVFIGEIQRFDMPSMLTVKNFLLGVLLYALRDRTYEERANAIFDMRSYIRGQFRDIRTNTAVGKALWSYIDSVVKGSHLSSGLIASSEGRRGGKRKKRDEDDEYRPQPVRGLGPAPKTRTRGSKTN
jgi:hypothetical protein